MTGLMDARTRPSEADHGDPAGIALRGVRHDYGGDPVLDVPALEIPRGALCVVVGPSGCGKSTLLSVVAGLLRPVAGRVELGGRDVSADPPGERDLAMVFQDFALYPHMTVAANVGFGLRLQARHQRGRGPRRSEIDERVAAACARFELGELRDRRPAQLSGGQRQRVALARAVVGRRPVLLLDEPLSALDAQLRQQARAELVRLHRELGATVVMVTHDQSEALSVATHLVVMRDGRVVQAGPPAEVYGRPADEFVATFLGSPPMNVLPDGGVHVGWRPADAVLLAPSARIATGPLEIDGVVDVVEFSGDRQTVLCTAGPGRFAVTEPTGTPRRVGETVRARVPAASLHRFDPTTGARL